MRLTKQLWAALCLGASLALLPAQAFAAWSVSTLSAGVNNSGASSLATASLNASVGHLVVGGGIVRGNTVSSITDGAGGNTWNFYACQRGANTDYGFIFWSVIANALVSKTITVNAGGAATGISFGVYDITGQAASSPADTAAEACNFSNSNTTTPTVTSGSPAQSGELFLSTWAVPSTATGLSYTAGGSWSSSIIATGNSNVAFVLDYLDATGSGAAQTNSPTTNSKTYAMPILPFKPLTTPATARGLMMQAVP